MSDLVIPTFPGLTWPVDRIPEWNTQVQTASSGDETRVALWSFPRWRWRFKYEVLRDAEYRQLVDFFNRHRGKYESFLYQDPDDDQVVEQAFGTGNGVQTDFQLLRQLYAGGFLDPVRAPIGIPTLLVGGVPTATGWSLQPGGIIRFAAAPAVGVALAWSGSFRFRCRFDMDTAEFSQFAYRLRELGTLEIVSLKK